jgi:hypothetical protein
VLIYFSADGRATVVNKLIDRLAPDGHFFVGHAETLTNMTDRLRPLEPTIYAAAGRDGSTHSTHASPRARTGVDRLSPLPLHANSGAQL